MLTHRMAAAAVVTALTIVGRQQAPALQFSDLGVYSAVLDGTIRSTLRRERSASKIEPLPVNIADQTVALCEASRSPEMSCIRPEELRELGLTSAAADHQMFGAQLQTDDRAAIVSQLTLRNSRSERLPRWQTPGLALIDALGLRRQSAELQSGGGRGFGGFSHPAYSAGGQAVVYAFYLFGNLGGYGWFVLLHHGKDGWEIQASHVLWMS